MQNDTFDTTPSIGTDTCGAGHDNMPAAWDAAIDIRADTCPMTFVRTRLALDRLATGQVLRVLMTGAEPRANIPRTATEQGHAVLAIRDLPGGDAMMWLRRG